LPRHDHRALPFCSLVYPNYLVCLCHFDHSVLSNLAVTTASLWTLGIALCQYSCMVMVPYEKVWIVGSCLSFSNFRPFHDELVERVRIPFFIVPRLFSTPIEPVRCGLSSLNCLVFVSHLIPFLRFPSLLWHVDQRRVSPASLPIFWLSC
jgi:hypothetical protein